MSPRERIGPLFGLRTAMIVAGLGCIVPLVMIGLSSLGRARDVAPLAEPNAAV